MEASIGKLIRVPRESQLARRLVLVPLALHAPSSRCRFSRATWAVLVQTLVGHSQAMQLVASSLGEMLWSDLGRFSRTARASQLLLLPLLTDFCSLRTLLLLPLVAARGRCFSRAAAGVVLLVLGSPTVVAVAATQELGLPTSVRRCWLDKRPARSAASIEWPDATHMLLLSTLLTGVL